MNRKAPLHVDFARHAEAMGAAARHCESLADFQAALEWAKGDDRTTVLSIASDAWAWVPGDADWGVGVPEVSTRVSVEKARREQEQIRSKQRVGCEPNESKTSESPASRRGTAISPSSRTT